MSGGFLDMLSQEMAKKKKDQEQPLLSSGLQPFQPNPQEQQHVSNQTLGIIANIVKLAMGGA